MDRPISIRDSGVTVMDVLRMIATGHSYRRILDIYPVLTMVDIMAAVQLCIEVMDKHLLTDGAIRIDGAVRVTANRGHLVNIKELRQKHPRAYEKWEGTEQARLVALFEAGKPFNEIAEVLGRNVGAVISRLKRLDLIR